MFSNCYLPGNNGGGPIRTISNLVHHLGKDYNFLIYTSDRDLGMQHPYANILTNTWISVGNAHVYYSAKNNSLNNLIKILKNTNYDCIYLNSFFNFKYSFIILILINFLKINNKKIILAPRGEFNKNALSLKSKKKKYFFKVIKFFNLYKNIVWQATSEQEFKDILRIQNLLGITSKIELVPNLPDNIYYIERNFSVNNSGLKICFISRLSKMKNLLFALKVLSSIRFDIEFNIYGPEEDKIYLDECKKYISLLPKNVRVFFHGSLLNVDVKNTLAKHDLFFLPTLGENYGHAIVESLSIGLPVLISTNTPWRGLKKYNAGWDISLDDINGFRIALNEFHSLNKEDRKKMSEATFEYAKSIVFNQSIIDSNVDFFLNF